MTWNITTKLSSFNHIK